MGFVPDYKLDIPHEEHFPTAIAAMEAALASCRTTGFFHARDGKKLYYEYFLAENSIGSVVIVHGLSEFTKKFYEFSYHLLNQGYNVFLYDQRCHGFSDRLTAEMDLIHIDSFDDLTDDLACYIDTVVRKKDQRPLLLYGHSMGGAVTALYLSRQPAQIRKAVLSSPLVVPTTSDFPGWILRIGTTISGKFRGYSAKFAFTKEYDPNYTFIATPGNCKSRVIHSLEMRVQEPRYRSTPMTIGCVRQCLLLRRKLLRSAGNIQTPVLILCSENDKVVKTKPQAELARKIPGCEHLVVKDADHAMMTGNHAIMTEHITRTLAHFCINEYYT